MREAEVEVTTPTLFDLMCFADVQKGEKVHSYV
jgi:hypothetical protein